MTVKLDSNEIAKKAKDTRSSSSNVAVTKPFPLTELPINTEMPIPKHAVNMGDPNTELTPISVKI